jgi:hypothetical protein
MLHKIVPPFVVSKINEFPDEDSKTLPSNGRDAAIGHATTVGTVASSAIRK